MSAAAAKQFVEKEIGGEKNGGKRRVRVNRLPRYYPTEDGRKRLRPRQKFCGQHKHKLRINQIYVMATKTKLDLKGIKIPDRLNDEYFRRQKLRKPKHTEGEIFDTKKEVYTVSDERKKDQAEVDKQILDVIRKNPEKKYLFAIILAILPAA
nr:hypothetical protein BaRGS_015396 [Batillaria attramentaria]